MTRSRVASAAAVLLLAWAALLVPQALAQTPSPSPSPSGASPSPSASGATPSPTASPERESLALILSAEPTTIEMGGETVVVAQVTNTGTGTVEEATLDVTLPRELELVSAFPAPASSAGASHSFELGPLDAGDSVVVQIDARGTDVVADAVVSATAIAGAVTASDTAGVSVVVTGGA
ncbi:MAG TPA: hypothetical protein VEU29_08415, partial [Actinomycetota bacterium]|nr:hypothetical protein [Actinomycetota bacterium]